MFDLSQILVVVTYSLCEVFGLNPNEVDPAITVDGYWNVATQVKLWLGKAQEVLMPLEQNGLAVLAYDCLPGGDQLSVTFGEERHQMLITDGKGRGVVRTSESAPLFVVCLVALRKAVGDITVVTDSQETVRIESRKDLLGAGV